MVSQQFDIVYTWVDDQWPGYRDELLQHARTTHDTNPNRTRDNLELLRFSLRSVEQFAPWRGNIYIVTKRPQIPQWLNPNHPSIRLVHHDEFMPADALPTFNSFAIQSCLHLIPNLSRRFVSFDDDMLLLRSTQVADFLREDGIVRYLFDGHLPRHAGKNSSPWNAALANSARLLNEIRAGEHPGFAHGPKLFGIEDCREVVDRWRSAFECTRSSPFRSRDNIAIETLLPQYLAALERAIVNDQNSGARENAYLGLENFWPWNAYWLHHFTIHPPKFLTLNDNFGARPNARAVRHVRKILQQWFPQPSAYELALKQPKVPL